MILCCSVVEADSFLSAIVLFSQLEVGGSDSVRESLSRINLILDPQLPHKQGSEVLHIQKALTIDFLQVSFINDKEI